MLHRFLARQLARPHGLYGRLVMAPRLNRMNATMNAAVLEQLRSLAIGEVLEIGFGGGALLRALLDDGWRASGVDLSEEMVDRLRREQAEAADAGRLDLRTGDVHALPFSDASFDAACTVNTVYFWIDPEAAFGEIRRVLRPTGTLVVCFNPAHELSKWPGHRHGFRLYSSEDIAGLLLAVGLRPRRTQVIDDPDQGEVVCIVAGVAAIESER